MIYREAGRNPVLNFFFGFMRTIEGNGKSKSKLGWRITLVAIKFVKTYCSAANYYHNNY